MTGAPWSRLIRRPQPGHPAGPSSVSITSQRLSSQLRDRAGCLSSGRDRDRGVRLEVRQSWPTRYARLPPQASPRGGRPSARAGCAGSTCSTPRWCPMGAMPVATSGGTARTPDHVPNAGPQRAARHGPPRLRRGVVLPQPPGAARHLRLVPDALAGFAHRGRRTVWPTCPDLVVRRPIVCERRATIQPGPVAGPPPGGSSGAGRRDRLTR